MEHRKVRIRIIITFAILFLIVSVLLLMIFFAGKKTYTVKFDLNGGTLISGSTVQYVTRGQNAVPPTVVKDGAFLRAWSRSHQRITEDTTIQALWEYETTPGIIYANEQNKNYTEITGVYEYVRGEIYLGAYHGDKKVLGIAQNAFADREGITKVYLLNGLLSIGEGAFKNCTALSEIEIPETVTHIEKEAFSGCTALEKLVLHEGLLKIGASAFKGCTSLKELVLPASLVSVAANAFAECDDLKITITHTEGKEYTEWSYGWEGSAEVDWPEGVTPPEKPQLEFNPGLIRPFRPQLDFDKIVLPELPEWEEEPDQEEPADPDGDEEKESLKLPDTPIFKNDKLISKDQLLDFKFPVIDEPVIEEIPAEESDGENADEEKLSAGIPISLRPIRR